MTNKKMDELKKRCTKCGETKLITEFYKEGNSFASRCKVCIREEHCLRSQKVYTKEYGRRKGILNNIRGTALICTRKQMAKYPERYKARWQLRNAVTYGKIVKEPCEVCGSTEKIQGHHEDYSKPLEVRWLCAQHHREIERKYNKRVLPPRKLVQFG